MVGVQDPRLTPEAGSKAASYGSAFHDTVAAREEGLAAADAVQNAWDAWGHWLDPEDLENLRADLAAYEARDFKDVRTVLVEGELRIPIMLADGLAFFRGKIDRLYERLDRPGHFIAVDYKSSKWPKTFEQINTAREDDGSVDAGGMQMWSYDLLIREAMPEVESLVLIYDQLRYGRIPVRKSETQRRQIRMWLAAQMTSFFADDRVQDDGLLPPRKNRWCPYCELMPSCPVIPQLTDFARSSIAAIRGEDVQAGGFDRYAAEFSEAKDAIKVLEKFVAEVREVAHDLPEAERKRLGFSVSPRRTQSFPAPALKLIGERIGHERLLELVTLPKSRLDSLDPEVREWALMLTQPAPTTVVSRKEKPNRRE